MVAPRGFLEGHADRTAVVDEPCDEGRGGIDVVERVQQRVRAAVDGVVLAGHGVAAGDGATGQIELRVSDHGGVGFEGHALHRRGVAVLHHVQRAAENGLVVGECLRGVAGEGDVGGQIGHDRLLFA